MAEQVTFLHAADLHLGAPFKGLRAVSGEWADRLVEAIPEAYDRMVAAAIDRAVDFVVMAGDIFDSARPSYDDFMRFHDGLNRLDEAGIPVYLCTGNHDPLTLWEKAYGTLPPNAHMFPARKPGFVAFERDGEPLVLLGGRGYYSQIWPESEDIAAGITRDAAERALGITAPFAVGITHTGLDLDRTKAPTKPSSLLKTGMDYWALGHIHMPYVVTKDDPRIVFSGCLQGRAVSETGKRGAFLVTLTEGQTNSIEFVPTASVVWQNIAFDASACETLADLSEAILQRLFQLNGEAQCSEMIERITLTGTTPLHALLQRPTTREDMRNRINEAYDLYFCDALIDQTRAPLDREKLEQEGLFPATLMKTCEEQITQKNSGIAFLQQAFLEKGLALPRSVEKNVEQLGEEAESLVLDLLGGGDDR